LLKKTFIEEEESQATFFGDLHQLCGMRVQQLNNLGVPVFDGFDQGPTVSI